MADSRSKNAKRNIIWSLANKAVTLLTTFVTRTVFIYTLGELYLGLDSLFASTLSFLTLAELGVGSAMVFSMYKPMAESDAATVCALLNLYRKIYRLIGSFMLLVGAVLIFFIPYLIKGEIPNGINVYILFLINLLNTVLSYFLFAYKGSIITADQRSDIHSNISSILRIVSCILQIIILLLFKDYYLYCSILIIITIASNLITNHIVKKRYPHITCHGKISKELATDIKKRIAGLFVYKICYVFRDALDAVFISAFIGLSVLGKYNNYMFILNSIMGYLLIVRNSITASIGNSIATESEDKNYHDFKKCQLLYMWISIWCMVCLFCLTQPFIKLWIGANYLLGEIELCFFCGFFICRQLGDICSTYRQAIGLWWQDRYRPVAEAVAKTILNLTIIKYFGVVGAFGGSIICLIFINSIWASWVLYRYYFKHYRQWEYIKMNIFYLIVAIIACAAVGFVCHLLPGDGIINFSYRIGVCIIVPNILLWAIFRFLPEFSDSIQMIKDLIKA